MDARTRDTLRAQTASFQMKMLPKSKKQKLEKDTIQGVHIVADPRELEWIQDKIGQWFEDRDDISVIDTGTTDKRGYGFIILEWTKYEIDPVFLDVLEEDDVIEDYSTYETEVNP